MAEFIGGVAFLALTFLWVYILAVAWRLPCDEDEEGGMNENR